MLFGCFECMAGRLLFLGVSGLGCVAFFCPRCWGPVFFSFRGFRLVTSPPCGGGFFCWVLRPDLGGVLAVLSAWAGRLLFWGVSGLGLRCVFLSRCWGPVFFSFRGFRLVSSPPCGGGFFCWVLRPDLGGVWLF